MKYGAHCYVFTDRWSDDSLSILDSARELGYYRPGPQEKTGPRQLDLFEAGACGTAVAKAAEEG